MAAEREYLPETPEELTSDWLGSVLNGPVQAVEQNVLGAGQGFMGDVLHLVLTSASPDVPKHLVAKLPKKANRTMGELIGVYEREIMFFREFGEAVPIRLPRLFFSEFDRDKGSENQREILRQADKIPRFMSGALTFVGRLIAGAKKRRYMLLIEYLEGMEPGDQLAGLDVEGCRRVLESIAPMHGKYWGDSALEGHFWLLELDIDARMRHGIFNQHIDAFKKLVDESAHHHLDWLREHNEALMRRFVADAPTTLLHCDLRLDNVVFDGPDCAFIDFQLVRMGPAAYDVAYFLTSALSEDADADVVDSLLRSYFQALGVADYTFEAFKRDYSRAVLLILAGLSSADDVEFENERGESMMAAWMRRLSARAAAVKLADIEYQEAG